LGIVGSGKGIRRGKRSGLGVGVRIGKALEMLALVCMLVVSGGGDSGGMSRK